MYLEFTNESIFYDGEELFATKYTKNVGEKKIGDYGCYAAKDVQFPDEPCTFDINTKILSGCSVGGGCVINNSIIGRNSFVQGSFKIESSKIINTRLIMNGRKKDINDFVIIVGSEIESTTESPFDFFCGDTTKAMIFCSKLLLSVIRSDSTISIASPNIKMTIYESNVEFKSGKINLTENSILEIYKSSVMYPHILSKRTVSVKIKKSNCSKITIIGTNIKIQNSTFTGSILSYASDVSVSIKNSEVDFGSETTIEKSNTSINISSSELKGIHGITVTKGTSFSVYSMIIKQSKILNGVKMSGGTLDSVLIDKSNVSGSVRLEDATLKQCDISGDGSEFYFCRLMSCKVSKQNIIGRDIYFNKTDILKRVNICNFDLDESFCFEVFPFAENMFIARYKDKTYISRTNYLREISFPYGITDIIGEYAKEKDIFPINIQANWEYIVENSTNIVYENISVGCRNHLLKETIRYTVFAEIIKIMEIYFSNLKCKNIDKTGEKIKEQCSFDILNKKFVCLNNDTVFVPSWLFYIDGPYLNSSSRELLEKFIFVEE